MIIVRPNNPGYGTKIIGVPAVADSLPVKTVLKQAEIVLVCDIVAVVELQAAVGTHNPPNILPDLDFDRVAVDVAEVSCVSYKQLPQIIGTCAHLLKEIQQRLNISG